MAYFGSVTITNKFGWSKTVEIKKALLLVGRNKTNDVVLDEDQGAGAAPLHLQLICPRTGESVYRIVNLADNLLEIVGGPSAGTLLRPRTAQEIRHGDVLVLGEFTLSFNLLVAKGVSIERRSSNLGMKLELPHLNLQSGKKLAGVLTLTNYGPTRRCQFTIEVDGLSDDCFQVSPAPLLYPGASGEVGIHFVHRGSRPSAGIQTITISATASQAYPQEMIQIPVELNVEPLYKFSLKFDKPLPETETKPFLELKRPVAETVIPHEVPPQPVPSANTALPAVEEENLSGIKFQPVSDTLQSEETDVVKSLASSAEKIPPSTTPPAMAAQSTEVMAEAAPDMIEEAVSTQEISLEDEQKWFLGQSASRMPQRQADTLSGSRKNIRKILAGKDIHVIKAGEEDTEEDTAETGSRKNASAE